MMYCHESCWISEALSTNFSRSTVIAGSQCGASSDTLRYDLSMDI